MDATTAEIRYQRWVQVIQDWSKSGLSKRDYCQQNERPALPEGSSGLTASSVGQQSDRPQIVKLRFPGMAQANTSMISFSVNGMSFSVPETIPASFLAKLLEAASHGSR